MYVFKTLKITASLNSYFMKITSSTIVVSERKFLGRFVATSLLETPWLEAFNVVLIMLQGVLVFFFPAFPLVLPDFIFNFEQEPEELEKEIQQEENLNSNRRGDDADNQGQELQGRYYYRRDSTAEGDQNHYSEPEISVIITGWKSSYLLQKIRYKEPRWE